MSSFTTNTYNTDGTAQTKSNSAQGSNAFVDLGWPLAIAVCGTVVASAALGHFLVWWVRSRAFRSSTAPAIPYFLRDLESGSVHDRPFLCSIRSEPAKKVLIKKHHLRLSAAPSNFTWESTGDFATVGPSPALTTLRNQSSSDLGTASKSTQWTELADLTSRTYQRMSTQPRREFAAQYTSTQDPPLPTYGRFEHNIQNWKTIDPPIHKNKPYPHEPRAQVNQDLELQRNRRYAARNYPNGNDSNEALACVAKVIDFRRLGSPSTPVKQCREECSSLQDKNQCLEAPCPNIEGSRLMRGPLAKPPGVLGAGFLPWSPEQVKPNSTEDNPHVENDVSSTQMLDSKDPARPVSSSAKDIKATSKGIREQPPISTNRDKLHNTVAAQAIISKCSLPRQGYHQPQRALSLFSDQSSAWSTASSSIESECEPFHLRSLIEHSIQNPLAQPRLAPPKHQ